MAQTFGKTWRGQQWLNSLNNIDYSNRLPRGSSYANKGAVTKITIYENYIKANVSGSRPKPYSVDIVLPPFFEQQISNFVQALAERPVIISKLLNRELNPEVLDIAESLGLKVFPRQWTDFKMQCSCPDWAVPCKHLAAVIYKVSAEIDNDPFLVFKLHNVDLIAEMNKRGFFITEEYSEIPLLPDLLIQKSRPKEFLAPLSQEKAYEKLVFSQLISIHEPLAALLSANPVFYPFYGDFKEKYLIALNRVVKSAQKLIKGKIPFEKWFKEIEIDGYKITTHSQIKVMLDDFFQSRVHVDEITDSILAFLLRLESIPHSKTLDYQPTTAFLHTIFHFSLHLIANGAVIPQIFQLSDKSYAIRWLPATLSKPVQSLMSQLDEMSLLYSFFWDHKGKEKSITKNFSQNLVSVFLTKLIHLFSESSKDELFINLFFKKTNYTFSKPGENALPGGIQAWLQKYYLAKGNYKPRIVVEESGNEQFIVHIEIEFKDEHESKFVHLKEILSSVTYGNSRFEILQSLTQLSCFINGLDSYINSKAYTLIEMNSEQFTPFLFQMIPAIQLLDVDVLLPKSLRDILKPKPSVKLKKAEGKSYLRLDQLLDFDWQVSIGDTVMDEAEFKRLLKKSEGLIKFKSQYMYVDKVELEKLVNHFNTKKVMSSFELLRVALSGEYAGAKVILTDEVKNLIKELTEFKEIPLPKSLKAELRPYQSRGYSWMYRNAQIGFGSVIADDMGLGKTLQVITTLLKYKEDGFFNDKKALVVVPTGLLSNWEVETQKFAPTLRTHIFHGTNRKMDADFDVMLTTYGIVRSEAANLKKHKWQTLIIDEAQNIKNSATAQSKAIKSIGADHFIAMSGTPVENRLSELWSILDFSNRGILGNAKDFHEKFGSPIEIFNDVAAAEKLKKVTAPFLMRRLKSDKSIISDLPDKIEMDCFATLTKVQASLYEKTLEEAMNQIDGIDSSDKKGLFVRQGLVLQMILALKQICNHPTQFLKNNILDASLSGKLDLLFDKLDSIVDSNEKVLLFTQFKEMGTLLQHFITQRYKESPLFYHGGCSVEQRKEMVNSFQMNHADKIFILSLKAAGTGLNLTAANHVIHYDLWWNPAVEAQATDRAYRIGQKSNIMVHRFISKNTFEERINDMIQSKKNLAELTVNTGENWIGNMSNKEIKQLFELG